VSLHDVGVMQSIQPGRWITYCVQCSAAAQLWVSPCQRGEWGEPAPPRYLFELAVFPRSEAAPIAPLGEGLKE
jgi:hypothetical protein